MTKEMFELYEEYNGNPADYLFFSKLANTVSIREQTEHASVYRIVLDAANPNADVGYMDNSGFMAASGDQMFSINMQLAGPGWVNPAVNGYVQIRRFRSLGSGDEVRLRANITTGVIGPWRLQWVVANVLESEIVTAVSPGITYGNWRLQYPADNAAALFWNAGVLTANITGTPLPDGTTDQDYMVHVLEASLTGLPALTEAYLDIDRVYFKLNRAVPATNFP